MKRLSQSIAMPRPSPSSPRRLGWLKLVACFAVAALFAAGCWTRRLPGRPVSPEWARGGSRPDNSLTYKTEDDSPTSRAPDAEVLSSPDFLFTMGEGSGWMGFDVIQVWPDGKCEYGYPDARPVLPPTTAVGPATRATTVPTPPPNGPATRWADMAAIGAELKPWRRATFTVDQQTVADLRKLLVDTGTFDLKRSYSGGVADGTQWFVRVKAGGHEKAVWCDNHFPSAVIRLNDFVRTRIVDPNRASIGTTTPVELPNNWLPDFGFPPSPAPLTLPALPG